MAQSHILSLENLTKRYPGSDSLAVKQVNLSLAQGEILGLLGPSGCGKTTLLRLIAGLEQPLEGQISIGNQIVATTTTSVPPEKRDVGMVFQDYALFPHLTVAKNIAFGLKQSRGISAAQMEQKINNAIQLVGLEGLANRYPHQLSGGQQQRVALARSLAPRPKVVLLDEPLSNLDVQVRRRLRTELRDILKTAGIGTIFVTHDQQEALSISDSVVVMQQGQIEQSGSPETIYSYPNSRFVAEFVTQANFIHAHKCDQGWKTELGMFQIPDSQILSGATGNRGDLMIRQEDLQILPDEQSDIIIRDREFLGRENCYRLQLPSGTEIQVRSYEKTPLFPQTPVSVRVDQQMLYLFPTSAANNLPLN